MKNAKAIALAALLLVAGATAFADEATPIPRIVVTAKRMSDAEKAREAALEKEAAVAARPAASKAGNRG